MITTYKYQKKNRFWVEHIIKLVDGKPNMWYCFYDKTWYPLSLFAVTRNIADTAIEITEEELFLKIL